MPHKTPKARRDYQAEYFQRRKKAGLSGLSAASTAWAKNNPEQRRRIGHKSRLKTKYGITLEEYEARFIAQDGRCAVCRKPGTAFNSPLMAVDHCHETGAVRGLLCGHCNSLLGYARDRIEVLYTAIDYLRREGLASATS